MRDDNQESRFKIKNQLYLMRKKRDEKRSWRQRHERGLDEMWWDMRRVNEKKCKEGRGEMRDLRYQRLNID